VRHIKLSAVVLLVIGFPLVAQTKSWRIGDDQPFPTRITTLPTERQRSILSNIEPSFKRMAKDGTLEPDELRRARESLLLLQIDTPAGPLLLIQGWGVELCGAVGNCALWALDSHDRVVLESGGDKLTILSAIRYGRPSILIAAHDSASEADLTWYQFDGKKYRLARCATETFSTPWKTYKPPLIENHQCGN
jgi:hypothetical protein